MQITRLCHKRLSSGAGLGNMRSRWIALQGLDNAFGVRDTGPAVTADFVCGQAARDCACLR